jgi:hypothetical protein
MNLPFEADVFCKYGAPMGRHSDPPTQLVGKAHLRQVRFYDYCYDKGGAYWGMGTPLYCAWNEETVCYTRARNRTEAKAQFPNAKFYR